MKPFLISLFLLCGTVVFSQDCTINAYQSLEYKDKKATVCGVVTQVYAAKSTQGKPVYLNFGGQFPNHSFTVVVWERDQSKFQLDLSEYEGKHIAVTGTVKEYDEKGQIVLRDPKNINIIK
ncbi:hypothetical protein [Aequorivita sp. KMM 9714]|uniref:hypothetical protein n=1 Tax=Aequorivita sp. KMM 9714 TaxID=2707173 RepID=UPI0013EE366F|nr:hypothetical protein [Aequorivita sp. KMM 9714]NGX84885.1 hypothetical protein [Aequorivita sp. KMM 9714]